MRQRLRVGYRVLAIAVAVMLTLSYSHPAAATTEISTANWGHWTYTSQWEFISWTDNYAGDYFRDGETDAYYFQQSQGGCVGPSSVTQTISGSLTYYTPRETRGPIYAVYGASLGCTYDPWGSGMTYNSPYVRTNTYDSYRYVRIFSQWYGAGATPNYFSHSRDWTLP